MVMSTLKDCRVLDDNKECQIMISIIDAVCENKIINDDLKKLRFYNEVMRGYECLKSTKEAPDLIQKYSRSLKKRVISLFVQIMFEITNRKIERNIVTRFY